jgi:hypothetical protein
MLQVIHAVASVSNLFLLLSGGPWCRFSTIYLFTSSEHFGSSQFGEIVTEVAVQVFLQAIFN